MGITALSSYLTATVVTTKDNLFLDISKQIDEDRNRIILGSIEKVLKRKPNRVDKNVM